MARQPITNIESAAFPHSLDVTYCNGSTRHLQVLEWSMNNSGTPL